MIKTELWTPTREWEGQDAFLIGGGASLSGFEFKSLIGRNVIGCNDAFHLGPEIVSICAFGDHGWWQRNRFKLEKWTNRLVTNSPSVMPFKVPNMLKMHRLRDGIQTGNKLGWNYSTGAMVINLAVSLGAKRIFLLGYDCGNIGKEHHWHQHNQKPIHVGSYHRFLEGFETVKRSLPAGIDVLNVTDGTSQLKSFPTISFAMFQAVLDEKLTEEVA
jgi:hypothetical protein